MLFEFIYLNIQIYNFIQKEYKVFYKYYILYRILMC